MSNPSRPKAKSIMSPFARQPANHRLLATINAIRTTFGHSGCFRVSAKTRNRAINNCLLERGQSEVSTSMIGRALRILRADQ